MTERNAHSLPKDLIPSTVVAEMLGIPRDQLAGWRRRHFGPKYYKFCRNCLYSRADVEAFAAGKLHLTDGGAVATAAMEAN